MTKAPLIVACLAACFSLTLVGCGDNEREYKTAEAELAAKRIADLEKALADCESRDTSAKLQEGPKAGKSDSQTIADAAGKDVAVSSRPHGEEIVLTIDNAILFTPGKAELTSKAKATLARVATILNEKYAGDEIRVEGFTDNEPIVRSRKEWADNWDLSGGRSRAVLKYLIERGVSSKRLGYAGYGENKTVAANSTEAGRAKNRRVEIVVLPASGKK